MHSVFLVKSDVTRLLSKRENKEEWDVSLNEASPLLFIGLEQLRGLCNI
jgi:hypothetical protein